MARRHSFTSVPDAAAALSMLRRSTLISSPELPLNELAMQSQLDRVIGLAERLQSHIREAVFRARLIPAGSLALGIWDGDEDLEFACFTTASSKVFFEALKQRVLSEDEADFRVLRMKDYLTIQLKLGTFRTNIKYIHTADHSLTDATLNFSDRSPIQQKVALALELGDQKLARQLSPEDYLVTLIPGDRSTFFAAFQQIKSWMKSESLYGPDAGFLDSRAVFIMFLMSCRAVHLSSAEVNEQLLIEHFHRWALSHVKLGSCMIGLPHWEQPNRKKGKEELRVLWPSHPVTNCAQSLSSSAALKVKWVLGQDSLQVPQTSAVAISGRPRSRSQSCERSTKSNTQSKMESQKQSKAGTTEVNVTSSPRFMWPTYVAIRLQFSGSSLRSLAAQIEQLQRHTKRAVQVLERKFTPQDMQLWPELLSSDQSALTSKQSSAGTYIDIFYLIGVFCLNKDDRKTLDTAVRTIQALASSSDPEVEAGSSTYVHSQCELWTRRDLPDFLQPIDQSILSTLPYPEDPTRLPSEPLDAPSTSPPPKQSRKKSRQGSNLDDNNDDDEQKPTTSRNGSCTTLRSAGKTLNDILWNAQFDEHDYVVGYEDRFSRDLLWTPVPEWQKDTTSMYWVPEHRIYKFKRISDGVIVWDRREKIDLLKGGAVSS